MKVWIAGLVFVCASILASTVSQAQSDDQTSQFDDGEVEQIERIIRDYLVSNPSIIREVFSALEAQEEAQKLAQTIAAISDNQDELLKNEADAVLGNPVGDITLVEFFDYNCGFCKRGLSDLEELMKSDPNLRITLKEFPILTPGSVEAARVSVAAAKQPKFWEFHRELLGSRGAVDAERAMSVAASVGLDMNQLRKDMADPKIDETIANTQKLASALGVEGTPAYVVGNTLVPGAIGVDGLRESIEEARKTACQNC